jgi:hypothetical protein
VGEGEYGPNKTTAKIVTFSETFLSNAFTGLAIPAASPQITMEIHISDWIHKFQNKTGLDAKANSELYKSNQINSVPV